MGALRLLQMSPDTFLVRPFATPWRYKVKYNIRNFARRKLTRKLNTPSRYQYSQQDTPQLIKLVESGSEILGPKKICLDKRI